jgi:predicted AAA+ superfamily ATPase
MTLKPWYKVVTPREDLREGRPLDASEFAVHLDQVRDGRAPIDYQEPKRFFERTYMTKNLADLASEVLRRLSGEKTETSAVFNMATQFGGGKTHALTLLYHLANHGPEAEKWRGVSRILEKPGVPSIPRAATSVFVGTEFDSISGRGGEGGEPLRKTPWGEIAYQLGGKESLGVVAEHENLMTAPSGEIIRKFLPRDKPCLILIDELMNYANRSRKMGMAAQMYSFLQNLSEEARGQENVVLVVSIPASELEMSAEDQSDHERFKKLLDRLGKAVMMSAEAEASEIIRRRLFEWHSLPDDAKKTIGAYADWVTDHRQQLPHWFPIDNAREAFYSTYPFHPTVISVFERKWQALPRFQQTRGILRLLAL